MLFYLHEQYKFVVVAGIALSATTSAAGIIGLHKTDICQQLASQCPFSNPNLAPDCVQRFCQGVPFGWGGCNVAGPDGYIPFTGGCCSSSNPAACLAAAQGSHVVSSAAALPAACSTVKSLASSCVAASSSIYINGNSGVRAQCLCYSNGIYNGAVWDGAEEACYSAGAASAGSVLWSAIASDGSSFCAVNAKTAANSGGSVVMTTTARTAAAGGSSAVDASTITAGTAAAGGSSAVIASTITAGTVTAGGSSAVVASTTAAAPPVTSTKAGNAARLKELGYLWSLVLYLFLYI